MFLDEFKVKPSKTVFQKVKDAVVYTVLAEIPSCGGYSSFTAFGCEYDCEYDTEIDCDQCVCVDYRKGLDPRTGKKFKKFRGYFS